jgi:hypothetical protein
MSCERWEDALIDLARNRPAEPGAAEHAAACESCAALLVKHRALAEDLRAVGRLAKTAEAPPHVEQAVMAAFGARQRRRRVSAIRWLSVAAALVVMITAALVISRPQPQPAVAVSAPAANDLSGFLPVPYRAAPIENGYIVRVQMPRSALVSLGMPVPDGEKDVVQADLLLADDGLAQAVRLVR